MGINLNVHIIFRNVQVCDATGDANCTKSRAHKKTLIPPFAHLHISTFKKMIYFPILNALLVAEKTITKGD